MTTYSTRPKRSNEIDGIDYHFVSMEEFLEKYIDGFLLEARPYTTQEGIWFYGSASEDYKKADENTVLIITPDKLDLIRKSGINFTSFLINVPDDEIEKRQTVRGDNSKEAKRRLQSDTRDFTNLSNIDFIVNNDKSVSEVAEEINLIYRNRGYQE